VGAQLQPYTSMHMDGSPYLGCLGDGVYVLFAKHIPRVVCVLVAAHSEHKINGSFRFRRAAVGIQKNPIDISAPSLLSYSALPPDKTFDKQTKDDRPHYSPAMPPSQSESPPAVESLTKNLNGWKNTAGRLLRSQGSNSSLNGKEPPEWLAGRRANGANGVNGQTESNGVNGTKSINGASDTASTFNPFTKEEFTEYLTWFITDEKARPGLKEMFFRDGITDEMASTAAKMANALCDKGCGKEIAEELALLTLYDLVILIG
jgi:hypothetical protein